MSDESLIVEIADGRTNTVPNRLVSALLHGSETARRNWRLIGGGEGIHWRDLDEDISVESLLVGRRSRETPESLRRWLEARNSAR